MANESKLISNWTATKKKVKHTELNPGFQQHHHEWMHRYIHVCSPHSNAYNSHIPGIFLVDLESFSILNKSERWVVRDGLIPLLHFFEKHPSPPKSIDSTLLFDRDLAAIVPKAWQKLAKTRTQIALKDDPTPTKLLVPSLMCAQYSSLEDTRSALLDACNAFETRAKKITEVALFTPLRIVDYRAQNDDVYTFNFVSLYMNAFGEKVQLLNYEAVRSQFNFSGYYVLDTNSKYLLSDSACLNHCLAAGGTLLNYQRPKEPGEVIYLSPFHGYYVEDKFPEPSSEAKLDLDALGLRSFSDYFMS